MSSSRPKGLQPRKLWLNVNQYGGKSFNPDSWLVAECVKHFESAAVALESLDGFRYQNCLKPFGRAQYPIQTWLLVLLGVKSYIEPVANGAC
jgi:hypothetical protein